MEPSSQKNRKECLPDMDSNHDKQIQRLLCYRYTIRQKRGKINILSYAESSRQA